MNKDPEYYRQGNIECIDFIADKGMNFNRGNAVKYIVRAGLKDRKTEVEDLRKAIHYIEFEINRIEVGKPTEYSRKQGVLE